MRKILFFTENFCGEKSKGGLEVATFRIAKALKDSTEWEVYHAFRNKWDGKDRSIYADVIKLASSHSRFERSLKDFISNNEIDIVVNMTRFFRHQSIVHAAKEIKGRDVKVIFMQHFAPGSEFKKPTFSSGLHLLKLNPLNPLYWLRASVYPLIKLPRNLRLAGLYKTTYQDSDKVILLSDGYKENYMQTARLNENDKFVSIPNIFEKEKRELIPSHKEKRVLILSRMDEIQKRVSLSLRVWAQIEASGEFPDWHLDIVGSGHDIALEKRLAKSLNLKNVTFHGWQDREPFLERSSILMMTSEYEGLPLSILEAQAYGVVPVVFNSFGSLEDVVDDEVNGLIVDNFGDIKTFFSKLSELMRNEKKRNILSQNAILNSDRFSSDKIVSQWLDMLQKL